jgi:hypothetical protein
MTRRKMGRSSGEVLSQADRSIGAALRHAVDNHYNGEDLGTAQEIRKADTDTDAAVIIKAIRQGRPHEVLAIAVSAASGAIGGVLTQKAINNAEIGGTPAASVLGVVPTIAGLAAPVSLSGRAILTAGGLTYITGTFIYNLLTRQPTETPV